MSNLSVNQALIQRLLTSINNSGNSPALLRLVDGQQQIISYNELSESINKISKIVKTYIAKPGLRIAILSQSSPEWLVTYLAALLCDATVVALDPGLNDHELTKLLERTGPAALMISAEMRDKFSEDVTKLCPTMVIDEGYKLINETGSLAVDEDDCDPNIASILFTSGTTGNFKGVVISQDNLLYAIEAANSVGNIQSNDNLLCLLPAHHIFGLICVLLTPIMQGASITFVTKLDGEHILETMQVFKPTLLIGVPRIYKFFMDKVLQKIAAKGSVGKTIVHKLISLSKGVRKTTKLNLGLKLFKEVHAAFGGNLRLCISGAASLSPELFNLMESLGFTVLEGYGLTETCALTAANRISTRKPNVVGSAVKNVMIKIDKPDESGQGEVCIKGPTVMQGYFRDPEATSQSMKNNWFHTGDLGKNVDGDIQITGRIKELIALPNGKKVIPSQVETYFEDLPGVEDFAITGLPTDADDGEEVHAAVVLKDCEDEAAAKQALEVEVSLRSKDMPAWWAIQKLHFIGDIPKTTTMKVKRKVLAQLLLSGDRIAKIKTDDTPQFADEIETLDPRSEKILNTIMFIATANGKKIYKTIGLKSHLKLDLGFDSLSSFELASLLQREYEVVFSLTDFGAAETIAAIINLVKTSQYQSACDSVDLLHAEKALTEKELLEIQKYWDKLNRRNAKKRLLRKTAIAPVKAIFRRSFKLDSHATENLPTDEAFIICPNHTSHLDNPSIMLGSDRKTSEFVFMAARDYFFKTKLRAKFLSRMLNLIPFDRSGDPLALPRNLKHMDHAKQNKKVIVLYPEGTRNKEKELAEFKTGIALFADRLKLKVVPAYIDGAQDAMPKGRLLPKRQKISVTFGEPISIDTEAAGSDPITAYPEFVAKIKAQILQLKQKAES